MHPLHGVNWRSSGPTDYCADLSVALHYYNAEDKWKDDHNLLGLGYEKLLSGCRTDAEAAGPGSVPPSAAVWPGLQNTKPPAARTWTPCPAALAS